MKYIPGYPGYKATSDGRIWSDKTSKFLSPLTTKAGYCYVHLYRDGGAKSVYIHRAVLMAFDPPASDNLVANHKDGVKSNNSISNLEWLSQKENIVHSYKVLKRRSVWVKGGYNPQSKPVTNGEKVYASVAEAARDGFSESCIRACLHGRRRTHHGYTWRTKKSPPASY